ncbi:MAG: hypothetical protein ACYDCK_00425 [Thermoplasmatota archaeon]
MGLTFARGLEKPHFLDSIWSEYRGNLAARIDPVYTATRWIKHSVMHRPFADANRRTAFLWALTHFEAFEIQMRVDTAEAIRYKETVKGVTFVELYKWLSDRTRDSK